MTAEEFLNSSNSLLLKSLNKPIGQKELKRLLVEFAKYHVEQALLFASEKVMLSHELYDFIEDSWTEGDKIDKQSILNAYTLENIK